MSTKSKHIRSSTAPTGAVFVKSVRRSSLTSNPARILHTFRRKIFAIHQTSLREWRVLVRRRIWLSWGMYITSLLKSFLITFFCEDSPSSASLVEFRLLGDDQRIFIHRSLLNSPLLSVNSLDNLYFHSNRNSSLSFIVQFTHNDSRLHASRFYEHLDQPGRRSETAK